MSFLVLVFVVIATTLALECSLGTAGSLAATPTNCSIANGSSDECIYLQFDTSLAGSTGSGGGGGDNDVYLCGNCSYYQNDVPFARNVSCCNSGDLCQSLNSNNTPLNGTCASLLDEQSCLNANNGTLCFWCNNASLLGLAGLCQPMPGGQFDACWNVPLVVPPPTCGSVPCAPFDPPYTVHVLTLSFLINFGFQAIPTTVARGIGLDARSRFAETRVMNDTYNFCLTNNEIQRWCGVNTTHPFKYCLVAESWPQADIWGWLQNTTFTAPSLTPIFPAFCACNYPGRAYYLPFRSVDDRPHFGPHCPQEHALLALYIFLMLTSVAVFIYVLYDTGVLVLIIANKKRRCETGPTLYVKICVILYFLVTIANQAMFIASGNNILSNAKSVLRFLGVIFLLFAFCAAVFSFVEILLASRTFGKRKDAWVLLVFKWVFLACTGVLLFAALGMTIGFAIYLAIVLGLSVDNLGQFTYYYKLSTALAQAIMLALLSTQSLMLIVTAILLGLINWVLWRQSHRTKGWTDLMARNAGLSFAWFMGWPNLGILAFITPVVAWITTGTILSYWASHYETNMAYLWLIWADFMTELMWITAISYAMRTVVTWSRLKELARNTLTGTSGGGGDSGDSLPPRPLDDADTDVPVTISDATTESKR